MTAVLAEKVAFDERFLNRELSWLDFNDRVLSLASEPGIPLLERAKFCAICSINLDEFFQVRVAALKDQIAAGIDDPTPDGRSPAQQLVEIGERVERLIDRQESIFVDELLPALTASGVRIVSWADLGTERPQGDVGVLRRADLPGAHAAGRRSRPSRSRTSPTSP